MGISNNNHGMKAINPHNNAAITTLLPEAKPMPSRLDYRIFNFLCYVQFKVLKRGFKMS
jgi:hypothetical protein